MQLQRLHCVGALFIQGEYTDGSMHQPPRPRNPFFLHETSALSVRGVPGLQGSTTLLQTPLRLPHLVHDQAERGLGSRGTAPGGGLPRGLPTGWTNHRRAFGKYAAGGGSVRRCPPQRFLQRQRFLRQMQTGGRPGKGGHRVHTAAYRTGERERVCAGLPGTGAGRPDGADPRSGSGPQTQNCRHGTGGHGAAQGDGRHHRPHAQGISPGAGAADAGRLG